MTRNRAGMTAAVLGVGVAMMPGCIAWDIHDEMKKTNEQLAAIKTDLDEIDETLAAVKASLGTTQEKLGGINDRLTVLEPIQKSLVSLDESLKTVKGLIEKIPFVGASEEEGETPAEEGATPPKGEGEANPSAPK